MNADSSTLAISDPWSELRHFTDARIALGRCGGSLPTRKVLDFRFSHARARDAVHTPFVPADLASSIQAACQVETLVAQSACADRLEFLKRPDLGRKLHADSRRDLCEKFECSGPYDLVILVSDGLSTAAAMAQSLPVLESLIPLLRNAGWKLAPLVVVRHARVALQDEVGGIFQARMSLMLLGERPGLGSTDSLGAYFTFAPSIGKSDAERNCVSNIRPAGLPPAIAARKLHFLLTESIRLGLSGVSLKDETPTLGSTQSTAHAETSAPPILSVAFWSTHFS